ncbi:hypothetical protein AAVH_18604 [Aphelenchoides avenae]|nr:hypothetical protein AAVH_18604 [Aphelenchus avenae]
MKRKTKNATEAYTHAMAAERDKLTYWTNARLDESHRKAAAVATDVADLDISDDDGKIFSWGLKQNLKVMKTKFIPRDMPRGNGLAVDAGIGCYIEQMRRSIVLYETPYVESSNFVDKTDAARDLALEIFNDHCSQDGSSYLFKENLLKEIKRERTKFEKINRQNLWLQYLRRAGAFFNGLIGHFIPWFRAQPSSTAPPFYRGSGGISVQIPGGMASRLPLLPADDGPKITEVL